MSGISKKIFFTEQIISYSYLVDRDLPWKKDNNPYFIWISEIILQQTRVQQGIPYFKRFVERFPSLNILAEASEDEVIKLWQGLGYYSRARNLHATAKEIKANYSSQFPEDFSELIKLKGIGNYTAAAISSFAFNKPYAVVDGNVYRVLSRYFALEENYHSSKGKSFYQNLAQTLIDHNNPGRYNQAIMDFGALVCKPQSPLCHECSIKIHCKAYARKAIANYPLTKTKTKKKQRFFNYFVIEDDHNQLILRRRNKEDIWKSLFDFPGLESSIDSILTHQEIKRFVLEEFNIKQFSSMVSSKEYKQTLSHQIIQSKFFHLKIQQHFEQQTPYVLTNTKKLINFAFPKTIDCYLRDNYINLYM